MPVRKVLPGTIQVWVTVPSAAKRNTFLAATAYSLPSGPKVMRARLKAPAGSVANASVVGRRAGAGPAPGGWRPAFCRV